jgi:hypothetical protein
MHPKGPVCVHGALLCPLGLLSIPPLKHACPPPQMRARPRAFLCPLELIYAPWGSLMPRRALVCGPPQACTLAPPVCAMGVQSHWKDPKKGSNHVKLYFVLFQTIHFRRCITKLFLNLSSSFSLNVNLSNFTIVEKVVITY